MKLRSSVLELYRLLFTPLQPHAPDRLYSLIVVAMAIAILILLAHSAPLTN